MTASAIPPMTGWHAVFIALAGLWAGMINTIVGSGTLVTFPVLVALGYPPLTATTSNGIGLITGTITGAIGYRREITGQRARLIRYGIASFVGAIVGALLLLALPPDAFESIVPILVGVAVLLVIVQPAVSRFVVARRESATADATADASAGASAGATVAAGTATDPAGPLDTLDPTPARPWWHGPAVSIAIFVVGVYGGYFTAAQGVLFVGLTGLLLSDPLQRLNGFKNVAASIVNLVSGVIYALIAPISWSVVLVLAISSIAGGMLGSTIGRRLSPTVLRVVIVIIGVAAIVQFVLR